MALVADHGLADRPLSGISNVDHNPAGLSLRALVAEDYRTHDRSWLAPGFLALLSHRLANHRHSAAGRIAPVLLWLAQAALGLLGRGMFGLVLRPEMRIGRRVRLDPGSHLDARAIGDDVIVQTGVTLSARNPWDEDARPTLGDRVIVSSGASVLGNATVGRDAFIGANAVVLHDVPERAVAGGIPALVVRMRSLAEDLPRLAVQR